MTPTYTTTAHGLRWLPGSNLASDIDSGFQALAEDVDTKLLSGGKSIIATAETRTNTAYGVLTTPDRVSNVVVPSDAIVQVRFMAVWQRSTSGATANAAIFIGGNQLQKGRQATASVLQEAQMSTASTNSVDQLLASGDGGLFSTDSVSGGGPIPLVTTGQIIGGGDTAANQLTGTGTESQYGPIEVFLAAGTYDIEVRYKSSSGSVTAQTRKLWVRVVPF